MDALFTAGGQQKVLRPGQVLAWTARNELRQVTPVNRKNATGDAEHYRYGGDSQRVLKVSMQKTGNSRQRQTVVYLPGLERRTTSAGDKVTEAREVITAGAGRAQVRVLHWQTTPPDGISNNPVRYSYGDLNGSSGPELDGNGEVISLEEYYPYGGTAVWTARRRTEADYKTVRYSGKERDATGLYYYGYRYYQPWAGRWLSADPAGTADGLNLFRIVWNNPVTLTDRRGLASGDEEEHEPLSTFDPYNYPVDSVDETEAEMARPEPAFTPAPAGHRVLNFADELPAWEGAIHSLSYRSH